ncbi:hypothetical protein GJ496_009721 [Pomphorhynchus laevis]|nr:hypothetical protein GJ496_009721 [Pomphorhynchus laevis]
MVVRQFTNNNIKNDEHHYGKRVAANFAYGDIRGAVREISSSDYLTIHNEETLAALIAHHPPAPPNLLLPTTLDDTIIVASVGQDAVRQAINEFGPGSSGATRGGCEAAAHITRRYLTYVNRRRVLLKIDKRNAYNSIHRDVVLAAVRDQSSELYRITWQAYAKKRHASSTTIKF